MTHACADCGETMPGAGIIKASTPTLGWYCEGKEICNKCLNARCERAEREAKK